MVSRLFGYVGGTLKYVRWVRQVMHKSRFAFSFAPFLYQETSWANLVSLSSLVPPIGHTAVWKQHHLHCATLVVNLKNRILPKVNTSSPSATTSILQRTICVCSVSPVLSVLLGTSRCRITLISSFGGQHTIIRSGITMATAQRCCPPLKNTI